jgi:hypothetical protein
MSLGGRFLPSTKAGTNPLLPIVARVDNENEENRRILNEDREQVLASTIIIITIIILVTITIIVAAAAAAAIMIGDHLLDEDDHHLLEINVLNEPNQWKQQHIDMRMSLCFASSFGKVKRKVKWRDVKIRNNFNHHKMARKTLMTIIQN